MKEQSYEKHTQYTVLQHYIWLPLSFILLLSVMGYSIYQMINGIFTFGSLLLLAVTFLAILPGIFSRRYALQLQDRLIRTEEQLRYFMLTSKRIDPSITLAQLIALRFAPDEEFIALVDRTIAENLSPDEIKKAIQVWKADNNRV
ncbi:DUF6526 family protein [Sporosarcina sp. CAU 1771]